MPCDGKPAPRAGGWGLLDLVATAVVKDDAATQNPKASPCGGPGAGAVAALAPSAPTGMPPPPPRRWGGGACPSRGSWLHESGGCRPCVYHMQSTCFLGIECPYCHAGHSRTKWKHKRAPKHVRVKLDAHKQIAPAQEWGEKDAPIHSAAPASTAPAPSRGGPSEGRRSGAWALAPGALAPAEPPQPRFLAPASAAPAPGPLLACGVVPSPRQAPAADGREASAGPPAQHELPEPRLAPRAAPAEADGLLLGALAMARGWPAEVGEVWISL